MEWVEFSLLHVLLGYPAFDAGVGPFVGVVELDLVLRPDSVPPAMLAPEGMIDSSSSSVPEFSGEEQLEFAIPFLFVPFVPARDERRPRPVLAPGVWASVAAVAGEDDISLHNSRGSQMF